eukprot:TRINITY_DN1787_c0_g1_i1.p1 TRINITY_DN1787_c0_g1~~TRINITY_DN1787_c0_g1_i1.p1  ORF type:complete len:246 (-),score=76.86 TRINITY_DN1787_c0_g1_i1:107-844(-)
MQMGDPSFIDMTELQTKMMSKEYAAQIRTKIVDDKTFGPEYYNDNAFAPLEDHGTTHISVIDKDRNSIAFTSTINLYFGSKFVSTQTGILMNNEMDDFSTPGLVNAFGIPPSPQNYIRPGKKPLSSMSPTIVLRDGKPELVVGAAGGSKIPTATLNTLLNYVAWNDDLFEAVQQPRLHHQYLPNELKIEQGFDAVATKYLASCGHNIVTVKPPDHLATVEAVARFVNNTLAAVSDHRGAGAPAGY